MTFANALTRELVDSFYVVMQMTETRTQTFSSDGPQVRTLPGAPQNPRSNRASEDLAAHEVNWPVRIGSSPNRLPTTSIGPAATTWAMS
ncbi:hypothetical protein GCM10007079_08790 [Nocardiopsis terrae]|uniref:Uncharacterized protein n=1 Tax=Nocardiopsis terrae TaxID=372655 RepID=A0ABR9HCY7_9ACTN|nr:hypothetical protein [Nocardiopsis terrae]GHC74491.1 hypothetical protein GCM10007079_08790 [Nocardiopsis terrae]